MWERLLVVTIPISFVAQERDDRSTDRQTVKRTNKTFAKSLKITGRADNNFQVAENTDFSIDTKPH